MPEDQALTPDEFYPAVGLAHLLQLQYDLQFEIPPPRNVMQLVGQERVEFIRWNYIALVDELHEALQEISWKPWASAEFFNRELFLKELVDAFHFFMNLLLVAAPTPAVNDLAHEFVQLYLKKREINRERHAAGYDGVSDKCPNCKRALDDVGVDLLDEAFLDRPTKRACHWCGEILDAD